MMPIKKLYIRKNLGTVESVEIDIGGDDPFVNFLLRKILEIDGVSEFELPSEVPK